MTDVQHTPTQNETTDERQHITPGPGTVERRTQDITPLGEAVVVPLSAYESRPVRWLWAGRVPLGKVTLLAGDPGLGKSFVTLDLAARTSSGRPMPCPRTPLHLRNSRQHAYVPPSDVLLLSAEDDPGDTIRPRLEALGADIEKVHLLPGVHGENEAGRRVMRLADLDRDMPRIHRALERIRTQHGTPRLVVIDPISAYMGQTDSHNNAQVRQVLAELSRLAQHHNVAIVCVTHLNKGGSNAPGKAVYRSMGSLAFTAAARVVLMVAKHPDDESKRVVLPVKSNLAKEAAGLAYRIVPAYRDPADNPGLGEVSPEQEGRDLLDRVGCTTIEWLDELVHVTADELERGDEHDRTDAVTEAEQWLRGLLAKGPMSAKEVLARCETEAVSTASVKRAKRRLGIEARRHSADGGAIGAGEWVWSLPEHAPFEWADLSLTPEGERELLLREHGIPERDVCQTAEQGEPGELLPTELDPIEQDPPEPEDEAIDLDPAKGEVEPCED